MGAPYIYIYIYIYIYDISRLRVNVNSVVFWATALRRAVRGHRGFVKRASSVFRIEFYGKCHTTAWIGSFLLTFQNNLSVHKMGPMCIKTNSSGV